VVAGQVYDAMTALQLYGFPQVFGMVSTWNHWRFVGTYTNLERNDLDEADKERQIIVASETKSTRTLKKIQQGCQTSSMPSNEFLS
jgi:hypothetical protein